jgi:DNA-binding transcriptional LysR family regulator
VELTDAGRALVPEARRTIAAAAAARSAVADVQGLERGSVSIGTGKALTIDLIMILTRFREAHPNIALNLHQGGSLELVELLDIVTRGLGVAIVPRSVAHRTSPVSLVSLGRAAPRWNVGIVVSADRPPSAAAQRLLEMVQAAAS